MQTITTHWAGIERKRTDFPDLAVRENTRWIDAGNVVSSAGIDMALYILQRL